RSSLRTEARTAAKGRPRSTQHSFCGSEPAAANERRERPDREPVPAEGSPPGVVDRGDARLGRKQRAALGRGGRDLEQHPDLARSCAGEAADAAAWRPGAAGRSEHDAIVLAYELLEPERAHCTMDAAASGKPAQPAER